VPKPKKVLSIAVVEVTKTFSCHRKTLQTILP
jgi:hypothetical protein